MKKIIVFTMLLSISVVSFSQSTNPSSQLTRQDYITKSKDQKAFAFISLGIAAITLPIAISGNSSISTSAPLAIVGVVSGLGSITLFLASARNKRKARKATASFDMKTTPQVFNRSFVYKSFPALSLKINL